MKPSLKQTLSVIFFLSAVLLLSYLRVFDNFELPTFDFRFKLRPQQKFNKDIIIIEISDDTLKELGSWPIPRDFHGVLVGILKEYGARQIIFDIIFSDKTSQDENFAISIKEAGNVYLPFVFNIENKFKKHIYRANKIELDVTDRLKKVNKFFGFISTVPDIDGKYRYCPLFIEFNKKFYPHISLIAAIDYLGIKKNDITFIPGKFIRLGSLVNIPLDEKSRILINYAGKWHNTFKHYSYYDILASYKQVLLGKTPRINLTSFKDKVCFIGLTATATCDLNPMPLETVYPMVGSNVNIFNGIVSDKPISRASRPLNFIILCVFSLVTIFVNKKFRLVKSSIFTGSIILILISLGYIIFAYFGVWIDLFFPLFVLILCFLVVNVSKYIIEKRKNELIEKELSVAKKIQESFLPKQFPKIDCFDISALMVPARQIGGDLYDCIQIDKNKNGIMIGDVSGKGVPAALFMAKVISDFRYFAKINNSPKSVLFNLNNKLSEESYSGIFVTMNYFILDTNLRKLIASNAGHFSPIIIRQGKALELSFKEGPPLGIIEGIEFSEVEFDLEKGDAIILYTDGIIEARNNALKEFGKEKLIDLIKDNINLELNELLLKIKENIAKYSFGLPQHDDFTIIAVKCLRE